MTLGPPSWAHHNASERSPQLCVGRRLHRRFAITCRAVPRPPWPRTGALGACAFMEAQNMALDGPRSWASEVRWQASQPRSPQIKKLQGLFSHLEAHAQLCGFLFSFITCSGCAGPWLLLAGLLQPQRVGAALQWWCAGFSLRWLLSMCSLSSGARGLQ